MQLPGSLSNSYRIVSCAILFTLLNCHDSADTNDATNSTDSPDSASPTGTVSESSATTQQQEVSGTLEHGSDATSTESTTSGETGELTGETASETTSGQDTGTDDTSDPWQPEPIHWAEYPEHPFRRSVEGLDHLEHIAMSDDGKLAVTLTQRWTQPFELSLFDVSNPDAPERISVLDTGYGSSREVQISKDATRAVVGGQVLQVFDLRRQDDPKLVAHHRLNSVGDIELSPSGTELVAVNEDGLHTFDLSVPNEIKALAALEFDDPEMLSVSFGFRLAALSEANDLVIIDLTDHANPQVAARIAMGDLAASSLDFARDAPTLMVGVGSSVRFYDLSTPSSPRLDREILTKAENIKSVSHRPQSSDLLLEAIGALHVIEMGTGHVERAYKFPASRSVEAHPNGTLVIVAEDEKFTFFDLRQPEQIVPKGVPDLLNANCWDQSDILIQGNTAYVSARELLTLGLADPQKLTVKATVSKETHRLIEFGDRIFATGNNSLFELDHSDERNPALVELFSSEEHWLLHAAFSPDLKTAYLTHESGFLVVDLASTPPSLLSDLYIRHAQSVVFSAAQGIAYVSDRYGEGLMAIDIQDPAEPRMVGQVHGAITEIARCGSVVVAADNDRLLIVDVSEPTSLTTLGELELDFDPTRTLDVSSDCRVASLTSLKSLDLVDLSDRTDPVLLGRFAVPGSSMTSALFPSGKRVLVAMERPKICAGIYDFTGPQLELISADSENLRYQLTWPDRHPEYPEQIAFRSSKGTVEINEVDQVAGTAIVDWALADEDQPNASLQVAVGNFHDFLVTTVRLDAAPEHR